MKASVCISENQKKNGLDAIIEGTIPGSQKVIDILTGDRDQGFVAYEVTLHFENLLENVHKDIESGASQVEIVTKDKADMEKAIKMVDADPTIITFRDRVSFCLISDFFD